MLPDISSANPPRAPSSLAGEGGVPPPFAESNPVTRGLEPQVNAYTRFADIYDDFVYDVFGSRDFCETITNYVRKVTRSFGEPAQTPVVDLACGTGVIAVQLAEKGFPVTGLDQSQSMLSYGWERAESHGVQVEFRQADMRSFVLSEPVPCIISTHDSLDHLYEDGDFEKAIHQVAENLLPSGLFIFDMNCWEGVRHLDGRTVFVETEDKSGAYHLVAEDQTLETHIVGFTQIEDDVYRRFEETLFQRCFENLFIEAVLKANGLELVERRAVHHLGGDVFKQLWLAKKPGISLGPHRVG